MPAPALISFIIATRNAAGALPRCLDSLRQQSARDFEVIVVDGASTDETVSVLQASADIVTRWISEKDDGIASAWNKALTLARGEWLCFLGADDRLADPEVVRELAPSLRMATVPVIYSRVQHVTPSGDVVDEIGEPWSRAKERLLGLRCLPHQGVMHHRRLFQAHGRFDERLRLTADHEFLLRALKDADAVFVPRVTVLAREGGLTTSPENYLALLKETRAALEAHGLRPPALRWACLVGLARAYLRLRAIVGDRNARRLADLYRRMTLRRPRYTATMAQ